MFAIVQMGGKQYLVRENMKLLIEKVETPENGTFSVREVALVASDKGVRIGTPFLADASIECKVLKTTKGKKVITFKMKSKKRYKRSKNHRQTLSEVEVVKIAA